MGKAIRQSKSSFFQGKPEVCKFMKNKSLIVKWNKKLEKLGLGDEQGTDSQLVYVGGEDDLEQLRSNPKAHIKTSKGTHSTVVTRKEITLGNSEKERKLEEKQKSMRKRNWAKFVERIKHKYDLTEDKYFRIMEIQDYRCAVCKQPFDDRRRPQIDHCHETTFIRGFLCVQCNVGLGSFYDDINRLKSAIRYLQRFQQHSDRIENYRNELNKSFIFNNL